jgi:hypothetical protein
MKDHQPNQCSRAGRRTPAVLVVALALQSGLLPGSEIGSAASVAANPAGKLAEPARADDRLSPAAFADPPIQNRPGCFWAWLNGRRLGLAWLPPYRIEISGAARAGVNQLEIRVANLWANRLNADSLLPESRRFTRSNLDRIQTDPTSDSSYGRVPRGKTRPVYTEIPPLMKSGLFGPVRIITPTN